MCSSGEFSVEARCRLAELSAWIQRGGGTGTATLETNLDQQLAGIEHDPLFQVFLDIRKAYNSLDSKQFLRY